MNLGLVSLILLLAAIVIGFARNCNVGILSIAFAMLLGVVYKLLSQVLVLLYLFRWLESHIYLPSLMEMER